MLPADGARAIQPNMKSFSEFQAFVDGAADSLRGKKVLMYVAAHVRCCTPMHSVSLCCCTPMHSVSPSLLSLHSHVLRSSVSPLLHSPVAAHTVLPDVFYFVAIFWTSFRVQDHALAYQWTQRQRESLAAVISLTSHHPLWCLQSPPDCRAHVLYWGYTVVSAESLRLTHPDTYNCSPQRTGIALGVSGVRKHLPC